MKFEKISADEAHNHRKDVANDEGVMAKGVPVTPEIVRAPKFDAEKRSARFVMSAEVPDRMGDVVVQEGLDTTNFEANPQALLFHNSRSWPIGKWSDVQKSLGGRPKRTEGTMILLKEGEDPDADRAARHIAAGTMRTVSIGFRPDWNAVEAIRDDENHFTGLRFLAAELLECSLVPIPALPAATMKELSTGMLSPESLELIKGVLENFELRDGRVLNRDQLEGAVREAEGNRTTHIIPDLSLRADRTRAKEEGQLIVDGTITANKIAVGAVSAAKGSEPKDGEEVPTQPDPTEDEKTKATREQAESVALFERHIASAREHARQSKEPGLWAKFLAALSPPQAAPVERADPPIAELASAEIDEEQRAALRERVERSLQKATAKVAEPNPA